MKCNFILIALLIGPFHLAYAEVAKSNGSDSAVRPLVKDHKPSTNTYAVDRKESRLFINTIKCQAGIEKSLLRNASKKRFCEGVLFSPNHSEKAFRVDKQSLHTYKLNDETRQENGKGFAFRLDPEKTSEPDYILTLRPNKSTIASCFGTGNFSELLSSIKSNDIYKFGKKSSFKFDASVFDDPVEKSEPNEAKDKEVLPATYHSVSHKVSDVRSVYIEAFVDEISGMQTRFLQKYRGFEPGSIKAKNVLNDIKTVLCGCKGISKSSFEIKKRAILRAIINEAALLPDGPRKKELYLKATEIENDCFPWLMS